MAIPRVKTTYSLPVDTVAALDRLAARWGVSRSAALVRVVAAAEQSGPPTEALVALDAWQAEAALDPKAAVAWDRAVRAERRAARSASADEPPGAGHRRSSRDAKKRTP